MTIGCVVLASGESVRFGANKLLADFAGQPMLSRLLDSLPTTLSTVVVTRSPAVQALATQRGFACMLHEQPHVCDTIRLGLERLAETDGCLFCVGDQPLLTQASIQRLLDAFQRDPNRIARIGWKERVGNPVLFPRATYPELLRLQPDESGGTVAARHPVQIVQAACAEELEDADTREALERLQQQTKE